MQQTDLKFNRIKLFRITGPKPFGCCFAGKNAHNQPYKRLAQAGKEIGTPVLSVYTAGKIACFGEVI